MGSRAWLGLLALSLAVRLLLWGWAVAAGLPPLFDEIGYLERARGWADVAGAWLRLEAAAPEAFERAYGAGHWPPLQPLVLGLALALAGESGGVAAARLLGVLFSAATTPIVYRLGHELAGARAAAIGALLHALAPAFLAYSHWLWAENLALALGLAGVACALEARRREREGAPGASPALRIAPLAGLCLGLAALARVALLPWALIILVWLAASSRRAAAAAGGAALLVLLPWVAVLHHEEDGRWLPLSTLGGYNLALGNHPAVPAEYGSSWGHEASKRALHLQLREEAARLGVPWQRVAGAAARRHIAERPAAALARAAQRTRFLWAPDAFPPRHVLNAVYPPLPASAALALVALVLVVHGALLFCGVAGLIAARFRHRGLWIALVAASMLPPALTVSLTRLHLPIEALLLPVIGAFLAGGSRPRASAGFLAGALALAVSFSTVPKVAELYWIPSAHYAPALAAPARLVGARMIYSDRLTLRKAASAAAMDLVLKTPGARFAAPSGAPLVTEGGGEERLRWPAGRLEWTLDVHSVGPSPFELEIRGARPGVSPPPILIRPVHEALWRSPKVLVMGAVPGDEFRVEIEWLGGGASPR
ncbi:MAG: hypothetical protein AAF725_16585 [Acidobacteriota bacterium]